MKAHFYKYFLILAALFLLGACSDDELNKTPIGRFASEDYLTTDEEAMSAIIGVYDYLSVAYNNYADWSSLFFAKLLPGDDVNAGGGSSADQPKLQSLNTLTHEYDNPALGDVWLALYRIVSSSNGIINNIGEDVSIREQVIAEAKFFRAYAYFELVTMFGAVPHYTVNPTTNAESHIPRTPVADIYRAIEQDLSEAAAALPLKSQLPAGQKFRIAKGTAQSLLGKALLYQGKYGQAHQMLQTVISSGEYALESDFGNIWLKQGRAGSETIFEVLYTSKNSHDWGGPWDGTAESNFMIQLMGPRGDDSFVNLEAIGYTNGWGFNVPTGKFGELLYNEAGAMRRGASVISEADFVAAGGQVNNPSGNNNWAAYEGYIRLKYATKPTETGPPVPEVNYSTPFKIIRYADVLLMAAEAYNKDSKDVEAVALIKLVRERAGFTNHASWENLTGNALFDIIVKERALELAFEGHRFWDLVRWGRAAQEISGFVTNKHELYPIPKREIDLNTAIELEDQNPGF